MADTFDRVFFRDISLGDLPSRPALCVNTTLLNNGQVAKFDRNGFSAWHVSAAGGDPSHVVPWRDFPLARAVAASAAFPVGLPPLALRLRDFPVKTTFSGPLENAGTIYLTDGGVLENLGIQTLLKSHRYASWNLIVSDAGRQYSAMARLWTKGFAQGPPYLALMRSDSRSPNAGDERQAEPLGKEGSL